MRLEKQMDRDVLDPDVLLKWLSPFNRSSEYVNTGAEQTRVCVEKMKYMSMCMLPCILCAKYSEDKLWIYQNSD